MEQTQDLYQSTQMSKSDIGEESWIGRSTYQRSASSSLFPLASPAELEQPLDVSAILLLQQQSYVTTPPTLIGMPRAMMLVKWTSSTLYRPTRKPKRGPSDGATNVVLAVYRLHTGVLASYCCLPPARASSRACSTTGSASSSCRAFELGSFVLAGNAMPRVLGARCSGPRVRNGDPAEHDNDDGSPNPSTLPDDAPHRLVAVVLSPAFCPTTMNYHTCNPSLQFRMQPIHDASKDSTYQSYETSASQESECYACGASSLAKSSMLSCSASGSAGGRASPPSVKLPVAICRNKA